MQRMCDQKRQPWFSLLCAGAIAADDLAFHPARLHEIERHLLAVRHRSVAPMPADAPQRLFMPRQQDGQANKCTILATIAEMADDIDKARAEAAKERAEERLKNKTENLDVNRAQYSLRRAIARLGAYNKLGR